MSLSIPLVDLGSLLVAGRNVDIARQANAAEQLTNAFEEYGLAYICLDDMEKGYAEKIAQSAVAATDDFFRLPQRVKKSIACDRSRPGVTRGYLDVGCESGGGLFERKEAFSYSYNWEGTGRLPRNSLEAENVWPCKSEGADDIRRRLSEYYIQAGKIMQAVAKALWMTWGTLEPDNGTIESRSENWLTDMIGKGDTISLMRCFHYFPQQKTARKETGSVAHTDWGFATLIAQQIGSESALQVHRDGKWHDVPPVANTFVVNCGDFASLLSRGRLHSPLHRVVLTNSERVSLVYFQYPDFDAEVPNALPGTKALSLLQNQSEKEQSQESYRPEIFGDLCFGKYIARKWDQVQRTGEEGK